MAENKVTRIFSKVYALPILVPRGTQLNNSNKLFLPPTPYLRNVKVAAIDFKYNNSAFYGTSNYITIVDGKAETRLQYYPINDLSDNFDTSNVQSAPFRLRLFNFEGVITENSYITVSTTVPASYVTDVVIGTINFYQI